MMLALLLAPALLFAKAETRGYCGKRAGTAGNASLDNLKGEQMIELARQGGDQHLLEQTDRLIKGGTQVGQFYCVDAELDEHGEPANIIKAFKQK